MVQTISATEARIHFGEVMRKAQNETILVVRDGKPEVIILSKKAYDELNAASQSSNWRMILQAAHQRIQEEKSNYRLTSPEDILHEVREKRNEGNEVGK